MDGRGFIGKRLFLKVLSLSPNYYAFLGGVFISASVNLYTGIFAADSAPNRWRFLLLSAMFSFLSGIIWSAMAWNLETINRLSIVQSPEFMDEQKIWERLVLARIRRLALYFAAAFCSAVFGLALLLP